MAVICTWNPEHLHRPGGAFGPPDETTYEAELAAFTGAADVPPRSVGDEPAAAHAAVRTSDHVPVLARLSN